MKHPKNELHKLAHDLRNSLSAIYTYAQLLEASVVELPLENKENIGRIICGLVKNMDTMITERIDATERTD